MKQKETNLGLIWANPYTGNLGVTALAFSSLFLLEKLAETENLKFKYFLLNSNGPQRDTFIIKDYKIDIINLPWNYKGSLKSLVKLVLVNWYQIWGLLKLDIALDIGAGDSFSDIYGINRFREINSIKSILHILGIRTILLPQTYGPFNSLEAKKKASTSIKRAQLVLARDRQSYEYIQSLIPNQSIIESIDVAFFLPHIKKEINKNVKIKIGINISGLLWNGGYTNNNQFNLKLNYQDLMREIILSFLEKPNTEVYLIAHVFLKDYENIENDYKVCVDLHQCYPATILGPIFKDPIEAKSFIGSLDFFTGSRMHSCIAAFSTGVPVFPLAYSRKFNGLFGTTLNYNYYGDLLAADKTQILSGLELAYKNRHNLKHAISSLQPIIFQKESELINLLSNAISKSK